jgi:tRNA(adenine34) deaminase
LSKGSRGISSRQASALREAFRSTAHSFICLGFVFLVSLMLISCEHAHLSANRVGIRSDIDTLEKEVQTAQVDLAYRDDPFVLVAIREALKGIKEGNGGIGACLVKESTGEVIEKGHNRQYEPYFKSDLHAEMDLLDRYEERIRLTRSRDPKDATFRNPRNMTGLVLYTSVEPCPMCMGRIINAGVEKVYYAAVDEAGGMATRFEALPPFWKGMAEGMLLEPARCSPRLRSLALKLFRPTMMNKGRSVGNRDK